MYEGWNKSFLEIDFFFFFAILLDMDSLVGVQLVSIVYSNKNNYYKVWFIDKFDNYYKETIKSRYVINNI